MSYIYTENDFDIISWDRIEEFVNKNFNEINEYLKCNNLKIKYIVPILRGGGIPGMILSHKFNNINILPIQLKYTLEEANIDRMISLDNYITEDIQDDECILLVEGNCATGNTLEAAKDMVINKFGASVKIILSTLTLDYSTYKKEFDKVIFKSAGMFTNEQKKLTEQECEELRHII